MTLQEQLRRGDTTSVKLVEEAIAKAKADTHNCFITITEERALAQAKRIDARRKAGEDVGILGGVPVAIKDLIHEEGVRTTCGSKILGNFVAPYDATVTKRLRDAGGISIGKLNMDEFAMGSSNENSAFGPVKNPLDPTLVAGGSSGGSAAAVAANIVFGTLGSDTGGSIRTPAAFCGVVGIKPTYGRVSRFGVTAFASSLDQVGPLAKTVQDTALMLQAIAGHDPRDSTSSTQAVPSLSVEGGAKTLRIGVLKGWETGCSPDVTKAVSEALQNYQRLGAELVEVTLPNTKFGISAYYMLATAEASSNLARYDGVRFGKRVDGQGLAGMYEATRNEGFGAEVKRRILLGTYVLSAGYYDAFYVKAQKARALIKQDFAQAFSRCDVIAMPTTPTTAFRIGEKIADPLAMYLTDVFTVNVNLAGLPAISLPCAKNVGLQLIGKHWDEATLLRAAHALEVA